MTRLSPTLLLLALGCGTAFDADPGQSVDPIRAEPEAAPTGHAAAARADLRIKRWRQLSLDLQGALELTADEVCKETGNFDCTRLHVAQLGGVSIDHALYEPIDWWTVTTGLSMERVVLQACWNRLEKDRAADAPVVFRHLPLTGLGASDSDLDAQSVELWRRLLARDPSADELAEARALHRANVESGASDADWAALLCFSLATSSEHLLY